MASKEHLKLPLLLMACLGCLTACSSNKPALDTSPGQFDLKVLQTVSESADQQARLSLLSEEVNGELVLHLQLSSASELEGLAVEIAFDPTRWQPLDQQSGELLGNREDVLAHAIHPRPGLLAYAEVQIASSSARPFNGSGRIASFRFAPGTDQAQRRLSSITAKPPVAQWDEGSWQLDWSYQNTGDYDQNSLVNISDLTPIGRYFLDTVDDPQSAAAAVDGDGNGLINIADITPIGVNYGNSLTGYRIWELASPLDWMGTQDTSSLADIPFTDALGLPSEDLLSFSYQYGADPGYRWLRLAPFNADETGEAGEFIFTYPSLQPLLSLAGTETLPGSGTPEDPYFVVVPDSIELQLNLQDSTDVTGDALSSYMVQGPAGSGMTGNLLELDASAAGDYLVTASHDSVPSRPYALHFHVNVPPDAQLSATPSSGHVPFTVELDASASSDEDGEITLVEWDFDNDGTFDRETGEQLTTLRRYEEEGDFEAVVRLTDDQGAVSLSAPLAITVLPPNQIPVPLFTADPLSGNTPLLVSFDASASTDPDGSIASLSWDFDNDGEYEISGSDEYNVSHTFNTPGIYEVVLRLQDDDGAVAFSSPRLINVGGNFPPVAHLKAVPNAGPSPLQVLLDATESSDSDGNIILVEWDFGGDGEYDQSGTELSISRTYTGDGEFHPVVRLTDNNGGVSVSEPATVRVGVDAGSSPTALLTADPSSGPAPLLVSLDASGSTDPDNDIVLVEFDFFNDGSWDLADTDDFIHEYEYPDEGSFEAVARVTDSFGHRSLSAPVMITVSSGVPPTAFFEAVSQTGTSPFDVLVNASGSSDPDGPVVLYEWDTDADGEFEFSDTSPQAQFCLLGSGEREIVLRVRDEDGMTDEYSLDFNVNPPTLGWNDWSTGVVNPLNAMFAAVGGRPAVAYQSSPTDIYFKRSSDAAGHIWPVAGSLVDSDLNDYPSGAMKLVGMRVSGTVPLLATLKGQASQPEHDMFVIRGTNSEGSAFAPPLRIVAFPEYKPDKDLLGLPLLADFSGLPVICYGSPQDGGWHHIRALDSQGENWQAESSPVNGSIAGQTPFGSLLQNPAGAAMLFAFDDNGLYLNRDQDGNGSGWDFRENLLELDDISRVQAISSSDSVLLLYVVSDGPGSQEIFATTAVAPSYGSWSEPLSVLSYTASQADCQLLLDSGKPVLLFSGNSGGSNGVHFIRAHNSRGTHWTDPLRISSQTGGQLRGADIVNGRLATMHLRSNGSLRFLTRE